jgi:hypothetical protein
MFLGAENWIRVLGVHSCVTTLWESLSVWKVQIFSRIFSRIVLPDFFACQKCVAYDNVFNTTTYVQ